MNGMTRLKGKHKRAQRIMLKAKRGGGVKGANAVQNSRKGVSKDARTKEVRKLEEAYVSKPVVNFA